MSCSQPSRHDALIERIMVGDLDPSSPEVVSLRECPDCKERMRQLASLVDLLEGAGLEQRATLEQARGEPAAPGADRIASTVEDFTRTVRVRRFPSGLLLAAIAAAAVVAVLLLTRDRSPSPPPGYHLGADVLTDLVPQGSVPDYDGFSWKFTLPQSVFFDLVIYDDTPAGKGRKVLEKKALTAPSWKPGGDDRRALPAMLRWEVRAYDGSGGLWTASARCSSSAH